MTSAVLLLWAITLVLFFFSLSKGRDTVKKGLDLTWKISKSNSLLILLAFIIVGYVNVLSPEKLITAWIGPGSGIGGILTAEFLGALLPGGPYVVFPIIATLYEAGAGLAPLITLITSWSTQSLLTISFELPFMGWRFSLIRWSLGLFIPLIAGLIVIAAWG